MLLHPVRQSFICLLQRRRHQVLTLWSHNVGLAPLVLFPVRSRAHAAHFEQIETQHSTSEEKKKKNVNTKSKYLSRSILFCSDSEISLPVSWQYTWYLVPGRSYYYLYIVSSTATTAHISKKSYLRCQRRKRLNIPTTPVSCTVCQPLLERALLINLADVS